MKEDRGTDVSSQTRSGLLDGRIPRGHLGTWTGCVTSPVTPVLGTISSCACGGSLSVHQVF